MILEPMNNGKGRHINLNTLILTIGFGVTGFLGREVYTEVRNTHDAVLVLKTQTTIQIAELKERIIEIEKRLEKLEQKK